MDGKLPTLSFLNLLILPFPSHFGDLGRRGMPECAGFHVDKSVPYTNLADFQSQSIAHQPTHCRFINPILPTPPTADP